MKIKFDPAAKIHWKLVDAPKGTVLRRVTFTFPSTKSDHQHGTTHHLSGQAKVNIRVQHPDGTAENLSGIAVEW